MNIRAQAILDQSFTLRDGVSGFGVPVIIEDGTNTIGVSEPFYCQVGRRQFEIDPDTQVPIADQLAHVTASINLLVAAGFDMDGTFNNWVVTTIDVDTAQVRNYTVRRGMPDRTLGLLSLLLGTSNRSNNPTNEALIAAYWAAVS